MDLAPTRKSLAPQLLSFPIPSSIIHPAQSHPSLNFHVQQLNHCRSIAPTQPSPARISITAILLSSSTITATPRAFPLEPTPTHFSSKSTCFYLHLQAFRTHSSTISPLHLLRQLISSHTTHTKLPPSTLLPTSTTTGTKTHPPKTPSRRRHGS
jgi:hypothetical protein